MTDTFVYLAPCPVCEQGLVRVRTMIDKTRLYPICQCDECEAAWKDPARKERLGRNEVDELLCVCNESYWSSLEEIGLFGWAGFLRPSSVIRADLE